jgi:hypothetical protein
MSTVKPSINIYPSPVLRHFWNAELLICQVGRFYRPTCYFSSPSVVISLLLLLSGVERNPGPNLSFGVLNVRSAVTSGPLIQDIIISNNLDILALTETWLSTNDPDAILMDLLPSDYLALHVHRPSATTARGGGLALVYRSNLGISVKQHHLQDKISPNTFELQLISLKSDKQEIVIANIYRPPSSSVTLFFMNYHTYLHAAAALSKKTSL